jgi:hypothetical protein
VLDDRADAVKRGAFVDGDEILRRVRVSTQIEDRENQRTPERQVVGIEGS